MPRRCRHRTPDPPRRPCRRRHSSRRRSSRRRSPSRSRPSPRDRRGRPRSGIGRPRRSCRDRHTLAHRRHSWRDPWAARRSCRRSSSGRNHRRGPDHRARCDTFRRGTSDRRGSWRGSHWRRHPCRCRERPCREPRCRGVVCWSRLRHRRWRRPRRAARRAARRAGKPGERGANDTSWLDGPSWGRYAELRKQRIWLSFLAPCANTRLEERPQSRRASARAALTGADYGSMVTVRRGVRGP